MLGNDTTRDERPPDPARRMLAALQRWGEARDWLGWDPYDALLSPFSPVLTAGTPLGRRLLTQAVKRSPVNLRPLLRIPVHAEAAGIAHVASAYVRLAAAGGEASASLRAAALLERLGSLAVPGTAGWSCSFPVQTRFFGYGPRDVNAVTTAFCADAYLDADEHLAVTAHRELVAASIELLCERFLADGAAGTYFRYVVPSTTLVHNANLLVAGLIARHAQLTGERRWLAYAEAAARASLAAQRNDGAWPYSGQSGRAAWVDSFHTGYVLESLSRLTGLVPGVEAALEAGTRYWKAHLLAPDGTALYYPDRPLPLDAQNFAQAIETLLALPEPLRDIGHARQVACRLAECLWDDGGFLHFQVRRHYRIRTPFVRWTNGTCFRALARLDLAEREARERPSTSSPHALMAGPT